MDTGYGMPHPGPRGDQTFESFELGPKSYSRSQEKPSEWISEYVAPVTSACEKLRRGDYLYPLPDYDHLIEHTRILREPLTQSKG